MNQLHGAKGRKQCVQKFLHTYENLLVENFNVMMKIGENVAELVESFVEDVVENSENNYNQKKGMNSEILSLENGVRNKILPVTNFMSNTNPMSTKKMSKTNPCLLGIGTEKVPTVETVGGCKGTDAFIHRHAASICSNLSVNSHDSIRNYYDSRKDDMAQFYVNPIPAHLQEMDIDRFFRKMGKVFSVKMLTKDGNMVGCRVLTEQGVGDCLLTPMRVPIISGDPSSITNVVRDF